MFGHHEAQDKRLADLQLAIAASNFRVDVPTSSASSWHDSRSEVSQASVAVAPTQQACAPLDSTRAPRKRMRCKTKDPEVPRGPCNKGHGESEPEAVPQVDSQNLDTVEVQDARPPAPVP